MASAELYASLHLIPDNHANIPPLSFLQTGCPSAAQPTASKHCSPNGISIGSAICGRFTVMNDTQMDRYTDRPHQRHNFGLKSGGTKLDAEGAED